MSPQVDPKNTSKRQQEGDGGFFPGFRRLLPGHLYLREIMIVLVAALMILVLYDFSSFVGNHSQYQADVIIRGVNSLDDQQVINRLSTIDKQKGFAALSDVSVELVRRDIRDSIPRFGSVTVRKEYPDQLVISVKEQEPVVLVARSSEGDRRIYLPAGEDGRLFRPTREEVEKLPDELPVVRGFEELRPGSSEFVRRWNRVSDFLDAVKSQDSVDRFEWIKVRTGGFLEAGIKRPKTLTVRFGQNGYSQKIVRLLEMMQTEQFLTVEEYVNLSDLNNVRVL